MQKGDLAWKLGFGTHQQKVLAEVIGTEEITPRELVSTKRRQPDRTLKNTPNSNGGKERKSLRSSSVNNWNPVGGKADGWVDQC